MNAKLNIFRTLSSALRTREWGRGAFAFASESPPGQAGQGRREADKGSAHPVRDPQAADRGRRDAPVRWALSVAVAMGLSLAAAPAAQAAAPVLTTGQATVIAFTTATLNGTVNPEGEALTKCAFEYGQTNSYGRSVPCEHPDAAEVTGSTPVSVHAKLEGLTAGATYRFRLSAENQDGPTTGPEAAFTTSASPAHAIAGYFGAASSTPPNPYPLSNPSDVAVDQSNGDVYVTDPNNHRVEKFNEKGEFLLMFGKEVNKHGASQAERDLCTKEPGEECQPGASASTPGAFEEPDFLAVDDTDGDLYVGDEGDGTLSKWGESGNLIEAWGTKGQLTGFGGLDGVAVDPSGNLFVEFASVYLSWYTQSGEFHSKFYFGGGGHSGYALGLAVDAEDNLYLAQNGGISKISDTGEVIDGNLDGGGGTDPAGLTIDPATDDLYLDPLNDLFGGSGRRSIEHYEFNCPLHDVTFEPHSGQCERLDSFGEGDLSERTHESPYHEGLALDGASEALYVANPTAHDVAVFDPVFPLRSTEAASEVEESSAILNGHLDPLGRGEVSACAFEWGTSAEYTNSVSCEPPTPYSEAKDVSAQLTGLTTNALYHYRLAVTTPHGVYYGKDQAFSPSYVPDLATEAATEVTASSATLNGSFDPKGQDTHYYFEWGQTEAYGHRSALPPGGDAGNASELLHLHLHLTELDPVITYHYRIVASNPHGTSHGSDRTFTTQTSAPLTRRESASRVHSESALLDAELDPAGLPTTYSFEYGPADCATHPCTPVPPSDVQLQFKIAEKGAFQAISARIAGLSAATTYHFRVIATNELGSGGYDTTFTTFPTQHGLQSCPNGLARQQTGAALLLDCRAYELVSAQNAGGYEVESNLIAGQSPYPGYPEAENPPRVLYGVHDGGIPGTDHPTNRGVDPYVATRTENGWSTEYVGVPANDPFAAGPFSSVPSGADAALDAFAFGGPGGCSPCFGPGGVQTGIPVRLPSGELVQGMVGAPGYEPGPTATPDGYIAADLSANGEHLIFGSTSRFAAGGNEGGNVSIYDRNLKSGETHVVSNAPGTGPLPCLQGEGECNAAHHDSNGISELAISADGSHVLLGQKVSEVDGNVYNRLYMDIDDSPESIELTPGATDGVLFDGMSADGSEVFFTTKDQQLPAGTPSPANLYEAEVSESGATLHLIASGSGSCDPVENSGAEHWNTLGTEEDCAAVAIGGGGGVATESGEVYFLSPERLEAPKGTEDQPNLYLAAPGQPPRFIATLSPEDPVVLDALKEAQTRHTADFQVTPSGQFAVFTTTRPLDQTYENAGHSEVYRYDSQTERLACVSCDPTNAGAEGDATLASSGLSLTDAGQVFFNSADPLELRDTDERVNVYESEPAGTGTCDSESPSFSAPTGYCTSLISSGQSPLDSKLLGVSANGTDVYFFTHDTLAPQDHNGPITKIYDAREGGGFFLVPEPPLCASSDECHGPGSQPPSPASLGSFKGTGGNESPTAEEKCKRGFVRRHGRCVRRAKPHRHHKSKKRHGKRNNRRAHR